jgi:hypothetical protein
MIGVNAYIRSPGRRPLPCRVPGAISPAMAATAAKAMRLLPRYSGEPIRRPEGSVTVLYYA